MTSDQGQNGPRFEPRFDEDEERAFDVDPYDRPAADPRRVFRRRVLGGVVALAALAGFGGIAWYATSQGHRDPGAVVPVITADKQPIKERPAEPGGLAVPNRDMQVFNQLNSSGQPQKVEQLLPPAEKPVARPQAEAEPAPPKGPAAPPAPAIQSRPEGQAAVPAAPQAPGTEVAKVPVTPPTMPKEEAPKQETKAAPAAPKPAAKQTASTGGSWRVQLGASKDQARAKAALARIVKANSDVLGSVPSEVVRADLGKKGVYFRMRAGAFADRAAADALCSKLKARKVGCIPVKS